MALKVLSPGLQTSIQTRGREGARHQGFPTGGVADRVSAAIANGLLGNNLNACVLECTLAGPTLLAIEDVTLALAGAHMSADIDGASISLEKPFLLKKNSVLTIGSCVEGARTYLSMKGGFETQQEEMSTFLSTDKNKKTPGYILKQGDFLVQENAPCCVAPINADDHIIGSIKQSFGRDWFLRAMPGPECPSLDEQFCGLLQRTSFEVRGDSDRMGVRLEPNEIHIKEGIFSELSYSGSVYPGTLQWPIGGAPILLGCDCQTTGGYPRILQVIAVDLPLIGQLKPGDCVWFRFVGIEEAQKILHIRTTMTQSIIPGFTFC